MFLGKSKWKTVIYLARGERNAVAGVGKSMVLVSRTGFPGINFKLLGFGVSCVWINMCLTKRETKKNVILEIVVNNLWTIIFRDPKEEKLVKRKYNFVAPNWQNKRIFKDKKAMYQYRINPLNFILILIR